MRPTLAGFSRSWTLRGAPWRGPPAGVGVIGHPSHGHPRRVGTLSPLVPPWGRGEALPRRQGWRQHRRRTPCVTWSLPRRYVRTIPHGRSPREGPVGRRGGGAFGVVPNRRPLALLASPRLLPSLYLTTGVRRGGHGSPLNGAPVGAGRAGAAAPAASRARTTAAGAHCAHPPGLVGGRGAARTPQGVRRRRSRRRHRCNRRGCLPGCLAAATVRLLPTASSRVVAAAVGLWPPQPVRVYIVAGGHGRQGV